MPCVYKLIVPVLNVACVVLMWYAWYEPYIGLDMYPILKKRNYSLIGGDAKIAPVTATFSYFQNVGKIPIHVLPIPKPKPIVITPH